MPQELGDPSVASEVVGVSEGSTTSKTPINTDAPKWALAMLTELTDIKRANAQYLELLRLQLLNKGTMQPAVATTASQKESTASQRSQRSQRSSPSSDSSSTCSKSHGESEQQPGLSTDHSALVTKRPQLFLGSASTPPVPEARRPQLFAEVSAPPVPETRRSGLFSEVSFTPVMPPIPESEDNIGVSSGGGDIQTLPRRYAL